jgi:hypothetical protein
MSLNVPSLNEGTWQDCAWTGKALRKYPYDDVTMDIMLDDTGTMIPAMPDDPFELLPNLLHWFKKHVLKDNRQYGYAKQLAIQLDVRCVPLKPKADKLTKEQHKKAIEDGCDRLDSMFPTNLIKQNIGSNRGLCRIMREHYEDMGQHHKPPSCSKYTSFNVDCNIFDRMLKVVLSSFYLCFLTCS